MRSFQHDYPNSRYIRDKAISCTTEEHGSDEMWMLDLDTLRHWRDVQIMAARDFLASRQKGGEG